MLKTLVSVSSFVLFLFSSGNVSAACFPGSFQKSPTEAFNCSRTLISEKKYEEVLSHWDASAKTDLQNYMVQISVLMGIHRSSGISKEELARRIKKIPMQTLLRGIFKKTYAHSITVTKVVTKNDIATVFYTVVTAGKSPSRQSSKLRKIEGMWFIHTVGGTTF